VICRPFTQIVAAVVALVFAAGLWLSGSAVNVTWLRYYSIGVFAATLLLTVWDRWLWRLPLFQHLDPVPTKISGTWRGTLESAWVDPATGATPPSKTVYLVVRQRYSSIAVVLLTDESRSNSTLARITTSDGIASLDYMYLAQPDILIQHRSRMHHGATSLQISGSPCPRLSGRYWTDRDSKGALDFTEHRPGLASDYEDAERLFPTR